jgi:GT2 family glycosyltransferase
MYDIAATIVVYHPDMAQLRAAVESFRSDTRSLHLEIIDNSCDDAVFARLQELGVPVHQAPKNGGYGYGHNLGLSKLPPSRYWLVMNPDVVVHPGTPEMMCRIMDEQDDVVLLVPKVQFPDGRLQPLNKRLPSVADLFVRRFLPAEKCEARIARYEMRDVGYDAPVEVPFCSGCFMLFRREVAERIGGFDDHFFMYLEDCDITRRAAEHGRCLYDPRALITHHWQRGSHKSLKLMGVMFHSMWVYFNKWGWKWV